MPFLIVLLLIVGYIAIGYLSFVIVLAVTEDYNQYDAPWFLIGMFWPVCMPIFLLFFSALVLVALGLNKVLDAKSAAKALRRFVENVFSRESDD